MHCVMSCSTPGLYSLDAGSTSLVPVVTLKNVSGHCHCPLVVKSWLESIVFENCCVHVCRECVCVCVCVCYNSYLLTGQKNEKADLDLP